MDGEIWDPLAGDLARPGAILAGFTSHSLAWMAAAARSARAEGRDAAHAVREAAWCLHPALSVALIGDGVDFVLARA